MDGWDGCTDGWVVNSWTHCAGARSGLEPPQRSSGGGSPKASGELDLRLTRAMLVEYGCGSKPKGSHFGVGAPPILELILVGIGMFTGGTGFWPYGCGSKLSHLDMDHRL